MIKVLNILLTMFISFVACNNDEQNIVNQLRSPQKYKAVTSKIFSNNNGSIFCSQSLYLNSDHTFLFEAGCENKSNVTIGEWKSINDSVELNAIPNKQVNLIANVICSKGVGKRETTFIVIDKEGQAVDNFVILPIMKNKKYSLTSNPHVVIDNSGKRYQPHETGDEGIVTIPICDIERLTLSQLELFANEKYTLLANQLPDTIKLYLGVNKLALWYSEMKYDFWQEPVKLKVDGQRLIGKYLLLNHSN